MLSTFNAKNILSDYKENIVEITCLLIASDVSVFQEQIREYSQGDIEIKIADEIIYL